VRIANLPCSNASENLFRSFQGLLARGSFLEIFLPLGYVWHVCPYQPINGPLLGRSELDLVAICTIVCKPTAGCELVSRRKPREGVIRKVLQLVLFRRKTLESHA
jgi:hypothetical protein